MRLRQAPATRSNWTSLKARESSLVHTYSTRQFSCQSTRALCNSGIHSSASPSTCSESGVGAAAIARHPRAIPLRRARGGASAGQRAPRGMRRPRERSGISVQWSHPSDNKRSRKTFRKVRMLSSQFRNFVSDRKTLSFVYENEWKEVYRAPRKGPGPIADAMAEVAVHHSSLRQRAQLLGLQLNSWLRTLGVGLREHVQRFLPSHFQGSEPCNLIRHIARRLRVGSAHLLLQPFVALQPVPHSN